MDHDIETDIAAGLSAGGFLAWRRKHAAPPGTPCYNCGTPLRGPWCYACGQLGEDFHRSAYHLIGETIESFTHADGRLWRTLPRLVRDPAGLTRDYLAGKRAPQVPPLRLFLVVLLLVFLAGSWASSTNHIQFVQVDHPADAQAELQKLQIHIYKPWDDALNNWARTHLTRAISNPNLFVAAMGAWAHDFAFLALPISALLLSMLFVFRRGVLLFDHLVFSMHSLAFQGLLFFAAVLLQPFAGDAAWRLLLASPVHLFFHMRGVYGLSWFGTLVRMFVLFIGSSVAFGLMMLALVLVGLASL